MASIISFPGQPERDWRAAEASIRAMLAGVPHDEAELTAVLVQFQPAFNAASLALAQQVDPQNQAAIGAWAGALAESLLFRIFLLELQLYRLQGPSP